MPRRNVPMPKQITCSCGSMVNLVPFIGDYTVMIPVDVDRDLDGGLVVVGNKAGYMIRPIQDGEAVEWRFRRRAHWDTCPNQSCWWDVMRSVGIAGREPSHDPMRSGPCARCRRRHPWNYGGPVSSPVCDRCRKRDGLPIFGEPDEPCGTVYSVNTQHGKEIQHV